MTKLRRRRKPVYKVVHARPDGKLVSAVVHQDSNEPRYARLAPWLERTYRTLDGRLLTVPQSMAFDTFAHAREFADGRYGDQQIWEARCQRAKRIYSCVHLVRVPRRIYRLFGSLWGEADGWTQDARNAPPGTLLCENLKLVRRLED